MCALWSRNKDDEARTRQLILETLADVRDQRSKLKLIFDEGVTTIKEVAASLLDFDISGLTVEVSSLKGASERWKGAGLTAFFRVRDREFRNREHFLTFDTSIVNFEQRPSGLLHFTLSFPQRLSNAQQRRGVRVQADHRKVPELMIWQSPDSAKDIRFLPPALTLEHYKEKQVKVDNFSASGAKIQVARPLLKQALPDIAKGQRLNLYFKAQSEPGGPASQFWVEAVLRNLFHDPESSETALGFEFLSEGFIDADNLLQWRPLRFDEVTGLGKFIFKWNLELYREKGLGG